MDSVVAVTNRIIAKDTTAVVPALAAARRSSMAAKALGSDRRNARRKRPKEAVPFLEFAIKYGDAQAKENAAALLYTGARPCCSSRRTWPGAAELLRMAVEHRESVRQGVPGGQLPARVWPRCFRCRSSIRRRRRSKSCDLAKQEETLLAEAETALTAGQAVNQEAWTRTWDHQAVQAADRVDAQGVLQVGRR